MKFKRKALAAVTAASLVLGSAGIAAADNLVADGDVATAAENVSFGDVCAGTTQTRGIALSITRNGNYETANVFKKSTNASVWWSQLSRPGNGRTTGITATPTLDSPGAIAIPSNWDSQNSQLTAGPLAGSLAVTFGTTLGAATGIAEWTASGVQADNTAFSRTDTINWSANVIDCTSTPIDDTAPTSSASATTADAASYTSGTWTNQNATVALSGQDAGSGVKEIRFTTNGTEPSASSGSVYSSPISVTSEGVTTIKFVAIDNAGNVESPSNSFVVKIDKTRPGITETATNADASSYTAGSWTNQTVTVDFTCVNDDGLSPLATSTVGDQIVSAEGETLSVSSTGSCVDEAGNAADAGTFGPIKIDKTSPTIAFNGGPSDGGVYYFGLVPTEPTCTGTDQPTLSGTTGSCAVSGYGSGVGIHTITGTQSDVAGNQGSSSITYEVKAWTLKGFYSPVDMGGVTNVVKAGSTVPLKFEVFAGPTELTSTDVVASFKVGTVSCSNFSGVPTDDIETYSTGGTSLRYDTSGGQFIQNWQTPKTVGLCYKVTLTLDDGSNIFANFRTK